MRTPAAQPVKNENDEQTPLTENENSQEDDSDHHHDWPNWDPALRNKVHEPIFEGSLDPELQVAIQAACKRARDLYGSTPSSTLESLERRVTKRFGRLIPRYRNNANLEKAIEHLAINLMIRDRNRSAVD